MKWLIPFCLMATPALAETWALGDCTTQTGTRIRYALHDGEGFITYNNSEPTSIYSRKEKNLGIITHIGSSGTMNMAIDLTTGRGYLITKHDNGKKFESNIYCKLSSVDK